MLIGIDASRANRDHKSGTEWYSYYLIRWLAKLDSRNQYILYSDKPFKEGLVNLTTIQHVPEDSQREKKQVKLNKKGYQKIKSPHNNFRAKVLNWRFPCFWTQIRLSWEMLIHRPDILFIPAHTLPKIHPRKSIVTIHDVGFERERMFYRQEQIGPEEDTSRKFVKFLVKLFTLGKYSNSILDYHSWSTKFALKNAKKIITVSNFSKDELIKIYGCQEKKIKVVYNGFNRYLYKKIDNKNEVDRSLKKHDLKAPFIFYVGRIEKKKNISTMIEAYAIMREQHKEIKHKLVLAGDASYGYDEVKYMIREFDLEKEVIMTGWIPEIDLPYIYNAASAFIFPSHYEGFGIPILQAMACGTPVAASRSASIPEVAGQAAIFFNPKDVRLMAGAMAKIILDDKLRNRLISEGLKRAKNFSWEKCARETLREICNL